ncbi:MAG: hypothetical protein LBH73_05655 [Spirochaetaceae bacterium]|jgi:hypothetical protein|nr:hypothetical protein [Spirochaetaceae bacterium]
MDLKKSPLAGILLVLTLLCTTGIVVSCKKAGDSGAQGKAAPRSWDNDEPDLILVSGANPLWFEFGDAGPEHIDGPLAASAPPYVPWPLSRHGAGLLAGEGELTLAVNRSGLLVFRSQNETRLALYALVDGDYWSRFSIAALFPYKERPAALLYRDDFFSDAAGPLPEPRVFGVSREYPALEALEIPAFSSLASAEGWDLEQLRLGNDQKWHFRGVQKNTEKGARNYYITSDLSAAPEPGSVGTFQNAGLPLGIDSAPEALARALTRLAALSDKRSFLVARALSPLWPMPRHFALNVSPESPGAAEPVAWWDGSSAYAALPDGRGVYAGPDGSSGDFSLPPLPESYVYTGFAFLGTTLIALWEEQDGLSVGAAGFMVVEGPAPRE